jgi:hypothetical protein
MDAIAALDQHAQRGLEIFALIGTVERVGKQDDFAAVFRPGGIHGLEHVAPERGQGALRADPGEFFEQSPKQRTAVAPIGKRRKA